MHESVRNNRLAIRRLVARAGASNPRVKEIAHGPIVEILVDPRPGIRASDLQRLQADLEGILHSPVSVSTPADLAARDRASTLQNAHYI